MLGDFAPTCSIFKVKCDNYDIFLLCEGILRPRPELESVPVVTLLVRAAWDFGSNPGPFLVSHLRHTF